MRFFRQYKIDKEGFCLRAVQLVERVCSKNSPHSQRLKELEGRRRDIATWTLDLHLGVLEAAKLDFRDGMFDDIRRLIRADLLDDFLSQADELLASGFNSTQSQQSGAVLFWACAIITPLAETA